MLDWLSEAAASLTGIALGFLAVAIGIWVGSKVHARLNPEPLDHRLPYDARKGRWPAILAGLAAFAAAMMVLAPVIDVLREYGCKSAANMEDCLDPPDRDWM